MTGRSRRLRWFGAGVLIVWFVASFVAARTGVPATEPLGSDVDRVVLFGVPGLTLDDLDDRVMPNLNGLAAGGATAASNVRTGGSTPQIAEAYVTLGAGYRIRSGTAGTVAADRAPQHAPPWVEVVDMPESARGPERVEVGRPGALGEALTRAGLATAVVTNADVDVDGRRRAGAPAAVAVADPDGDVDLGTVGPDLTVDDPHAPGGVDTSSSALLDAFGRVSGDAALIVVDPGITTRYHWAVRTGGWPPTTVERNRVMSETDRYIGDLAGRLDERTALIVLGVTPPGSTWQLTPVVMTGAARAPGHLVSPSTHREGLVTITDIAPSILEMLDVPVPESMTGQALSVHPGSTDLADQSEVDELLVSRRSTDQPFTLIFILAQSLLYAAGVLALVRGRLSGRFGSVLLFAVLACAAWPLATFWIRASTTLSSLGAWTGVITWAIALAVAAVANRLRSHPLDPLLAICGAFVATIVMDLSTGASLQFGSFFGYAPNKGTRFIGIGNAAFALLGAATVVVCTALVARARPRSDGWWAALLVAVAVVVAEGAPWMGSDVGGILSLVPVLGLLLWVLRGTSLTWRTVTLAVLAAVAALAVAVGLDALRSPSQRTHIGRFFLNVTDWELIRSTLGIKISANLRVLRESVWAWLVPITVALSLVALVSGRLWQRALPAGSPERQGLIATLALALLGWILNDSGIVVVALASVFVGPYVLLIARARETGVAITREGSGSRASVPQDVG